MTNDPACRYNSSMGFKKGFNPFYVLLVIVGTAFCLTACAYGLMAMRALRPERPHEVRATASSPGTADANGAARPGPHQLLAYMERNGEKLLLIELAVLTVATFAAMGTDSYWIRRAQEKQRLSREAEAGNAEPVTNEEQVS
ncbi:MAG: hypothetical protein C0483_15680 [Pirellula sp.]|nr:hypothetical protein [Pirellula sp.]